MALKDGELWRARERLGEMWGLGRPLKLAELARLLCMRGRNASATIKSWEDGKSRITGPASVAIEAMLTGWRPADIREKIDGLDIG